MRSRPQVPVGGMPLRHPHQREGATSLFEAMRDRRLQRCAARPGRTAQNDSNAGNIIDVDFKGHCQGAQRHSANRGYPCSYWPFSCPCPSLFVSPRRHLRDRCPWTLSFSMATSPTSLFRSFCSASAAGRFCPSSAAQFVLPSCEARGKVPRPRDHCARLSTLLEPPGSQVPRSARSSLPTSCTTASL